METKRGIVLRISSEGHEQVTAALRSMGTDGQAALRQLERGTQPVSAGFRAIDTASRNLGRIATGELQKLGRGIIGLISPVNLLLTGFGAALGAAVSWFSSASEEAEETTTVTDRLAERVSRLRDLYGEARQAQQQMSAAERSTRLNDAENDLREAMETLDERRQQMLRFVENIEQDLRWGAGAAFDALAESVRAFEQQLQEGGAETDAFVLAITALARGTDDVNFDTFVSGLLANANALATARGETELLEADIAILDGTATAAQRALRGLASGVDQYSAAIAGLAAIAPTQLTDREAADAWYRQAVEGAESIEARVRAFAQWQAALARIADADQSAASTRASQQGQRAAEQETQRLRNLAAVILGEVNPALAAKRELEARLVDISALRTRGLLEEADALAATAGAHETYASAMDAANAPSERFLEMQERTKGWLLDIAGELQRGATLWQAFADAAIAALNNIANRTLSAGIDNIFGALAGGGKGGGDRPILNAIASVFTGGRATGWMVPVGRMALVGERGPELAMATPRGALVLPSGLGGGGGGGRGGDTINISVTVPPIAGMSRADLEAMTTATVRKGLEEYERYRQRRRITHDTD